MSNPICLIDYDPLKYASSSMAERHDKEQDLWHIQPIENVYFFINAMVKKCIKRCESKQYQCFITPLGSRDNFRFAIYSDYKANRKDKRKPYHLQAAHEYGLTRWKCKESKGEEADDTISIVHYSYNTFGFEESGSINSVICSIDKDFDNCAGWHYNPKKDEFYFVSEIQALRNFYLQILTGDTADNVPRVKKGWKQAKAEEKIQKALTEQELYDIVLDTCLPIFIEDCKEQDIKDPEKYARKFIKRNGQLVWLRRESNELWEPKV